MAKVTCVEIKIKLGDSIRIQAGDPDDVQWPQFNGGADPDLELLKQVFDKLATAVQNGDPDISLKIGADGVTIIKD